LDQQVAKVPGNAGFQYLKGNVFFAQKDLEKAQDAFELAVNLNKDFLDALISLGQVYNARGMDDKAVSVFEQCMQKFPKDVRAFLLLGNVEENRNNWKRAQELYEKSLQVSPDNGPGSNNLAFLMLEHGGNVDVALTHAQVARQKMPDSPNVADTLGWAYYHKGVYGQAINMFELAVKLEAEQIQKAIKMKAAQIPQESATFHYHLGLAYQKVNEPNKARTHFKRALELKPAETIANACRKSLAELGG
jgi:tetratricopeptide (TPR) repeat protein